MCSEYQYIMNGIADPTMTTNFSDNYTLKTDHHYRRHAGNNQYMQTKMNKNLKTKKMQSRTGVVKPHKAFKNFPMAGDLGDKPGWNIKPKLENKDVSTSTSNDNKKE